LDVGRVDSHVPEEPGRVGKDAALDAASVVNALDRSIPIPEIRH
jgi:hypothetical protein